MANSANDTILALDGVVAGYGKLTVLHGTSFEVVRGAITTIIGPNGAGKSTVFKAVFGLLPVASGRIVFNGRDITHLGPKRLLEGVPPIGFTRQGHAAQREIDASSQPHRRHHHPELAGLGQWLDHPRPRTIA